MKRPLCVFVLGPDLHVSSGYTREASVKLLAAICCISVLCPTPTDWQREKGTSFSAVTVVWQITDGRAKIDPGDGGFGDSGLPRIGFGPAVQEWNGLSSRAGMKFLMLTADSIEPASEILAPRRDIVNWFGSLPSFLSMSGRSLRRALMNQLQTCSVDRCVCWDSKAFLALRDRHCIGAHTASLGESEQTPWAGCPSSSSCLNQPKRRGPEECPCCPHPRSHCRTLP